MAPTHCPPTSCDRVTAARPGPAMASLRCCRPSGPRRRSPYRAQQCASPRGCMLHAGCVIRCPLAGTRGGGQTRVHGGVRVAAPGHARGGRCRASAVAWGQQQAGCLAGYAERWASRMHRCSWLQDTAAGVRRPSWSSAGSGQHTAGSAAQPSPTPRLSQRGRPPTAATKQQARRIVGRLWPSGRAVLGSTKQSPGSTQQHLGRRTKTSCAPAPLDPPSPAAVLPAGLELEPALGPLRRRPSASAAPRELPGAPRGVASLRSTRYDRSQVR
jgi:hypothetical protein